MLPYNKDLVFRARYLRKNMTAAEKKMWYKALSSDQLLGLRFLRQKPIEKFIVDFYCSKIMLVIEIDGETHAGNQSIEYDSNKTKRLEKHGIKLVRYTNKEVLENFQGVLQDLHNIVYERIKESTQI